MATDAQLTMQASTTKTATFNGSWIDLGAGVTRPAKLAVRVIYSAASNASGANTVIFSLDSSPDNGVTVYSAVESASDHAINLSTTAQAGEIWIPFATSQRYIRLTVTISGAGSGSTITYGGEIELQRLDIPRG